MPPLTGSFDKSGCPVIKISIHGVFEKASQEFDAIIDTGFTGFVSMPILKAFPLGLVLAGTTTTILADGSTSYKLTAWGYVVAGNETQSGIIMLENQSNDVLLGMDFLKRFNKDLRASPDNHVELTDRQPSATES